MAGNFKVTVEGHEVEAIPDNEIHQIPLLSWRVETDGAAVGTVWRHKGKWSGVTPRPGGPGGEWFPWFEQAVLAVAGDGWDRYHRSQALHNDPAT